MTAVTLYRALALVVVMSIPLFALVDAVRRPHVGWRNLDQRRGFWVPLLVVATLLPVIGLVAAVPYLRMVRRV